MEKIIKLPFVIDETVRCYLCNAFFGGILSSYKNMEGWIVEHYIQMFYVDNRKILHSDYLESQINYYGGWTDPLPLFHRQLYSIPSIDNDIVFWIRKRLEEGYYCYTYVNEACFGKQYDNAHDIIIFGKDDYREVFWTVGYYNKRYETKVLPFELFANAYKSGVDFTLKKDENDEKEYIKLFKPRFDSSTICKLDINNIIIRSEEYINSINTGILNACDDCNHFMYEMDNSVYGIGLYKKWLEELLMHVNSEIIIDYRKFHAVYEHKLMMRRRLTYLQKEYNNVFAQDITDNDKLIQEASALRLLALKYNNSLNKETLLFLVEKIKVLEEMDRQFMNGFLCKLKGI